MAAIKILPPSRAFVLRRVDVPNYFAARAMNSHFFPQFTFISQNFETPFSSHPLIIKLFVKSNRHFGVFAIVFTD